MPLICWLASCIIRSFVFTNQSECLGPQIVASEVAFGRSEAGQWATTDLQHEVELLERALSKFMRTQSTEVCQKQVRDMKSAQDCVTV